MTVLFISSIISMNLLNDEFIGRDVLFIAFLEDGFHLYKHFFFLKIYSFKRPSDRYEGTEKKMILHALVHSPDGRTYRVGQVRVKSRDSIRVFQNVAVFPLPQAC